MVFCPEIPLLGIYPGEMKTHVHIKTQIHKDSDMNVHSSFFIISPDWKHLKCPPGSEQMVMQQNRRWGREDALTGPAGAEPRPPGWGLGFH